MPPPADYSSQRYWSDRFASESSFEWLASSEALLPTILESAHHLQVRLPTPDLPVSPPSLSVLHFGCGTSTLGIDIHNALLSANIECKVVDADYAAYSLLPHPASPSPSSPTPPRPIPLIQLDVLDPASLAAVSPEGGWHLLIDKSTTDAISCGPHVPLDGRSVEPIEVVCRNLASVTRRGGRWICVSYSERRFAHLQGSPTVGCMAEWTILRKQRVGGTYLPEGRTVREASGSERIVYEPETGVWIYVLKRT